MSYSYAITDEGVMLKVGDLVAVKELYLSNEWRDVFKVINVYKLNNKDYVNLLYYATKNGVVIFKNPTVKCYDEPMSKYILIEELNIKKKNHLPRWF